MNRKKGTMRLLKLLVLLATLTVAPAAAAQADDDPPWDDDDERSSFNLNVVLRPAAGGGGGSRRDRRAGVRLSSQRNKSRLTVASAGHYSRSALWRRVQRTRPGPGSSVSFGALASCCSLTATS